MLAGGAVISGLVICPVEVKISSYDYVRGSFFVIYIV